jgi:hypothetical protein
MVDIGSGVIHSNAGCLPAAEDMPFRSNFPAICLIRASFRSTKRGRTDLLSKTDLDELTLSSNHFIPQWIR